ncbi:hypothetical protein METBIDRAFT_96188 [Metschnikowia bicuspidata var. bicuspidata NRRL YB-4993]|uniref:Hyphally-regulated cell wall protein N-terminal domain-containing protein n=1 Tax=Metschnikowia bicuspidata var. bicuspidata NRRL YB-4993 TaxID=869754 RepID=A0A1A0HGM4_9ASCO|nr:hypothetical protein METBIDRAFT_96188 [Metschnikowia bicuspidata var. bicuspidata NRRL YB-4993]OBA23003.1 hypothetical protein METBIDRAFT_96188 [Metschnikowia bicuspidata var. bicuspidata NRRL YB-4993]
MYHSGLAIENTQTVYLSTSTSVLQVSGLQNLFNVVEVKVAGFGNSNAIDLDICFLPQATTFEYLEDTGTLEVTHFRRLVIRLQIGPRYVSRHFRLTRGLYGSRIIYHLPAPHYPPDSCSCEPVCP